VTGLTTTTAHAGFIWLIPQNPPPTINHSQILNNAIGEVVKRLNKKECGDLFGNINPWLFLEKFVSIGTQDSTGQPFPSESVGAITTSDFANAQREPSGSIVFNQDSFLFTGTVGGRNINDVLTQQVRQANGLGNLNFNQIRQLAVLHELMHINDTAGTYNDLGRANPSLNNLIRAKCF